ncbi:MaoC/PaaZ C-terminal domain-containing protein [Variovorax sp. LjRoot290]|uniref:MaoC family dehydratase n=1 Tax=unclassified Variovorax TaxID=663243 RepID=UPI003ED077E9
MNGSAAQPPEQIRLECGPITAVDLALYAAASSDHNPLHLDEDTARAAGFDRPVVHGMLTMAMAARLMTSHFGPNALRSLESRFLNIALRGQRIVLTGTLQGAKDGVASYALDARNDEGRQLITGSASVRVAP